MNDAIFDAGAFGQGRMYFAAVRCEQGKGDGDVQQLLAALAGRRFAALLNFKDEPLFGALPCGVDRQVRRASLMIPLLKLRQIAPGDAFKALDEILNRHRLPVMALKIQVHAFAEQVRSENGGKHAHDLGAFFIDGRSVKIVDLTVFARPRRVGEGPLILRKLVCLQPAHFGNPLDGARALVGGKFMVAVDRQPFFQAQLKPVAAGDAVTGPVVEIFMRDHGLDARIISVSGGVRIGKNIFVVEDVQPLVFHRAHIE